MAEWSNASDSRSDSFGSAGSNPAGANSRISHSKFIIVYFLKQTTMKSDNNNKQMKNNTSTKTTKNKKYSMLHGLSI